MELEIDGTHTEQMAIMKSTIKQHHAAIYGNGQPGMLEFIQGTKAQFRLIVLLISIIGVLVAVLTLLEGNRQIHNGELQLPNFHAQQDSTTAYASDRQYAGGTQ